MHVPIDRRDVAELRYNRPTFNCVADDLLEISREIEDIAALAEQQLGGPAGSLVFGVDNDYIDVDIAKTRPIGAVAGRDNHHEVSGIAENAGNIESRTRRTALSEIMREDQDVEGWG